MPPCLQIDNLSIEFRNGAQVNRVVKNISLEVGAGESVALVGASGSGKSVSALSALQLLPKQLVRYPSGKILFKGKDVLRAQPQDLHQLRGGDIGMIFQEPLSSLNPLHTLADQVEEMIAEHQNLNKKDRASTCEKTFKRCWFRFYRSALEKFSASVVGRSKAARDDCYGAC